MASEPLILVPANDGLHHLAVASGSGSSQALAKPTTTCVDPALGKDLTKSIKTVSKKVEAAYSSFSAVKRIINDPTLDLCKVEGFRKEWVDIEEEFKCTLFDSSKVAGSAAAILFDFVSTIIPFLLQDSDMELKQQELHSYRKNLADGSKTAFGFSHGLRGISMRASNFEKDWSQHSASVGTELQGLIAQLEREIRELDESLSEAERNLMSEMREARFESPAANATLSKQKRSAMIKERRLMIRKTSLASSKQVRSEQQVTKHAGVVQDNADDLMVVWNLILENVNLIESHIKITENGKSPELFKQRVEKLAGQYDSLMINLKNYSSAISRSGRPNLWRALITIFKT